MVPIAAEGKVSISLHLLYPCSKQKAYLEKDTKEEGILI